MLNSLVIARMMANAVPPPSQPGMSRQGLQRRREARNERLIPAAVMPSERLALHLDQQPFLPGVSLGDLLGAVSAGQHSVEKALFKRRMKAYNALGWFQKMFQEPPRMRDAQVRDIPFETLERRYEGRVGQLELFSALCELREHRLISLDTSHPYRVGMTAKGRDVLQRIEKLEPLPAYDELVDEAMDTFTP